MDRRTLILVGACLALFLAYPYVVRFFGLGQYLGPPQGQRAANDTTHAAPRDTTSMEPLASERSPQPTAGSAAPRDTVAGGPERTVSIETPLYRAWFSTRGARLMRIELKRYASAHGASLEKGHPRIKRGDVLPEADRVELGGEPSLHLDLGSGASLHRLDQVAYQGAESLDAAGEVRAIVFTARTSEGANLRQTYRIRPDDYCMDLEVEIHGVPDAWRISDYSLTARSWPLAHEHDQIDEERSLRASSLVGTTLHREPAGSLRKGPKTFEGNPVWAVVQTRYFMGGVAIAQGTGRSTVAGLEQRVVPPSERALLGDDAKPVQELLAHTMVVSLPGELEPPNRFLVYFGPNEYFRLAKLGHGLERVVDLGWPWITPFSRLLLQLMVWVYGVVRNYGVAIVVLATLVRMLLHPLSMISIKSMREMQKVQPEIERLKDKYKNDAQALNTAMMGLYKEHKINPAGGCLPMLVQMPLFIALYSVLFNAIELRQAPLVAWVTDLSAPDTLFHVAGFPIRLLPVLMALSGLLQQRMTPTDPRQASSMYLMNVLMLVFFYNLPSGLVLYWTVMNLLTALQQWIALREDGGHPAAAASAVVARGGAK